MFIVSLPYGVYHGGYWAILATVGISHICCHTGKILVECLYEPDPEKPGTEDLVKVRYSYKVLTPYVWKRKGYYQITRDLDSNLALRRFADLN